MNQYLILLCAAPLLVACDHQDTNLTSPNGNITACVTNNGKIIATTDNSVPQVIDLGILTSMRNFVDSLQLVEASAPAAFDIDYTMPVGKRSHCTNQANSAMYCFANPAGDTIAVELTALNDGIAFRYKLRALPDEKIIAENTAYIIPDGQNRWIQTYHADSYEDYFPLATDGNATDPRYGQNWGYPALTQLGDSTFALITEAGLLHGHAASYLNNADDQQAYVVTLGSEMATDGIWTSPWRVAIIGSLADIVESTLVTDLSPAAVADQQEWMQPGAAAWVYWAYNHGSNDYQIVKKYIDLAADMQWPYVLIDAEWDVMGNGGNIEDALAYARDRGVKPLIWYNSSVGWVDGAPTPKYRLNDPEQRRQEMAWMRDNGVAGIKVDFFNGDMAETIDYYIDILEDALEYGLLVNFHGATLPRGWQRTYPNLMTMEAVYGAEWYNNLPFLTERAAAHNATLPFTRNVVGSMDYTPGTFTDSQHPHITTYAHELALMLLFESALQHMPDRPEAYEALPPEVRTLLSTMPTAWDDTKLIAGYPGEYVVIARRKGDNWYVAGINGKNTPLDLSLDLSPISSGKSTALLYADSDQDRQFAPVAEIPLSQPLSLSLLPRGGFLLTL